MDECYGKQIDYYNQQPNSSKVLDDLLKRLEKAENINEKLKNQLFNELHNFTILDCCVNFMILYSDGEPSASGCWENVKLSFKIDKDKKQILLDIYEKYEWIDDPRDPHHYKRKGYNDNSTIEKVTYSDESILPVPAIIDFNECSCELIKPPHALDKSYYYLDFNNKAEWEKRRRREITDICIPVKEVKYKSYFKKLFQLLEDINIKVN